MTGARVSGGGHLDEGTLLRAIDGQLAADERAAVVAHLGACRACADARDGLAAVATEVTRALDATLVAPAGLPRAVRLVPRAPARAVPRWLMAAALVFFAVLGALAFPQGRAWAAELWRMLRPAAAVPVEAAPRAADPPAAPADRVLVEVTPTDPVMVLEFAARGTAGTVSVEPHQSPRLVLRGDATPPVLVFPSALRVSNDSMPRADFRVLVPPAVQALVVRVGGREVCRTAPVTASQCRLGSR